ncbi:MAG: DUF6468 domain-containing protein [Pseudomonadota bacterium]
MQNEILSLILNAMMAGLLLATIIYCLKLNSRIRVLQDSKSELARIIREFDESTTRATQSITEIHAATNRISENIQHKIDRANYLADDLQYMIEKGNKLTGKVDSTPARPARSEPVAAAQPQPARAHAEPAQPRSAAAPQQTAQITDITDNATTSGRRPLRMRSRAEQELITMLGNKNSGE